MDLPCHQQENYSALFHRHEHRMARTNRIAVEYDIDVGRISGTTTCRDKKVGRSFHVFDNKQAHSILQHVLSTFE